MNKINQFDIAFIVDVTASMGVFIASAKSMMVDIAQKLAATGDIDMQIGVVAYRDHPPQDNVLVSINQLTTPDEIKKRISKMSVMGGGDGPEAVLDGVMAAAKTINWRKNSRRVAVLIGDAPPHGIGAHGDGFPKGCPCGETIESSSAALEEAGVALYAIALSQDRFVQQSFGQLAQFTGGEAFTSSSTQAVDRIQSILKDEFGNLSLDRRVLEAWTAESTVETVAEQLGEKPSVVAASHARLTRRGLIANNLVPA